MAHIQITGQFDIVEVAQNIEDYRFESPISVEEFTQLFENMNPRQYRHLVYQDVLQNVQDEIPDAVVEVLVSSGLYYNDFVYQAKLKPSMIKKLIASTDIEYDRTGLISKQNLSLAQFKTIVTTSEYFDPEELADAVGESRNPDWAKFIVKSWNELPATQDEELNVFQYYLFISFGSLILSDNDSRKLFGKVRPPMSSEELRAHEPCAEGWKRTLKWAGRSEVQYSWNEFIARHIMASTDAVESAKSDLEWLAESVADELDLFDM